jgi:uncharacterized protein (TIGR02246 family)
MSQANSDEATVRGLFEAVVAGWNARDPQAIAAGFLPNGTLVGFDGTVTIGQANIERDMRCIFADHQPGRWIAVIRNVWILNPNYAVLHAVSGWLQSGPDGALPKGVQMMSAAREDGPWCIALLQATPAQYHGFPEKVAALDTELRAQ